MGYAIKYRKGAELESGRKTKGGFLRTQGNRSIIFDTKEQAEKTMNYWIKKYYKSQDKIKKVKKIFYVKKV